MNLRELLILNRALPIEYGADATPRRIHIVPRGELVNKDAGVTQIFDDASIDSIFADLVENKSRHGGLYMGEEHFIYDPEKSSQAFSWAKNFEKDAQGIWAISPEHTDVGLPAIQNKRFKWTSLVADPAQAGAVENLGGGKIRVLKIDTVGYTNYPNGKNLLAPISNSARSAGGSSACPDCGCKGVACNEPGKLRCPDCKKNFAVPRGPADSTANQQEKVANKKMKTVCTLLGLSAEADEPSVHAAVTKLMNRVTELTPLADENTKLTNRLTALDSEQVDGLLAEHKITDGKVINRLKPILTPLANRADRVACLTELGFKPAPAAPAMRVLNRGGGAQAVAESADESADEKVKVTKIKNRAEELTAKGGRYGDNFTRATREFHQGLLK